MAESGRGGAGAGGGAGGPSEGKRSGGSGRGQGGAAGPGGTGRPRGERQSRTVYILAGVENPKPQPVQIKTGISDGAMTEVTEGLKEGDQLVTAMLSGEGSTAATRPTNPFGGGMRRF